MSPTTSYAVWIVQGGWHNTNRASAPQISKLPRNGPNLLSFDPTAHKQYLMFLVKAKDGAYTPVSGQTDANWSVEPLALPAPATP